MWRTSVEFQLIGRLNKRVSTKYRIGWHSALTVLRVLCFRVTMSTFSVVWAAAVALTLSLPRFNADQQKAEGFLDLQWSVIYSVLLKHINCPQLGCGKLVQITTNVIMQNRKIYSLLVYSVKYAIIMLLTFITYQYYDENHYGICAFFRRNEKICSHVYT